MNFDWMPYLGGLWIFPLLCLAFMAIMMLACGGMMRGRHRSRSGGETVRGRLQQP